MVYLVFKWLHIISVISWMAGILYLIRLFVYHSEQRDRSPDNHELLKIMEYRLLKYITVPAMVATWITALVLITLNSSLLSGGWLHFKILLVLGLSGATGYCGKLRRKFMEHGSDLPTSKFLRIFNEVPTVLMVVIVALVVFKPF